MAVTTTPVPPVEAALDERAARRDLRDQIARLERELAELGADAFPRREIEWTVGAAGGPRVLGVEELERLGAGELQVTSIERDSLMEGYDLRTIAEVAAAVSIPVIASGGAGSYLHMEEAVRAGASAVSAASIYLFTQATPLEAKAHLAAAGIPVRSHFRG